MKKVILPALGLMLLVSCEDDKPQSPGSVATSIDNVWVLNEGNFQSGNSELGVYNIDEDTYSANVFTTTNTRQLGDVLQSAAQVDNEVYLVINNSGKIEVVDHDNFASTGTITGFTSPRYALKVSASEVYVSDLFSDSIAVVNPATKTIDRYIDISSTSEQMVMSNGKVFVANTFTSHITVIDVTSGVISTVATSFSPTALDIDKDGKVWVLCGGDPFNNVNGAVEVVDPSIEMVTKTIALNGSSYTNKMAFNEDKDSLYFLQNDVYKVAITATDLPTTPFLSGSSNSFYGLDYIADIKQVWLTDAKDFSQKGEVIRYSRSGNQMGSFACGISPNGFWVED